MATSSTGLQENIAGVLCYAGGWVTGIVFILLEDKNRTVRFHAWQSLLTFGGISVVGLMLHFIPFIGRLLDGLLTLVGLVLWVVLMVQAYQGVKFKLPVVGDLAEARVRPGQ